MSVYSEASLTEFNRLYSPGSAHRLAARVSQGPQDRDESEGGGASCPPPPPSSPARGKGSEGAGGAGLLLKSRRCAPAPPPARHFSLFRYLRKSSGVFARTGAGGRLASPRTIMGRSRWPWLGILALSCALLAASQTVRNGTAKGRSFIGHKINASNASNVYHVDDFAAKFLTGKWMTVFLPLVYTTVFIIGLPSNAMALWVFFFRTKKKHPAVIYMANLALADLLFVVWFPLKIAYHVNGNNWIYGEGLCKVLVGFFFGNMYCSILFMTCLSVQRYWVIVNPIVHSRKKSEIAMGISLVIWILILLGTVPLYLVDQTAFLSGLNITTCHDVLPQGVLAHDMYNYFLSLAIGVFLFPAVLTSVAYILMIKTLNASIMDVTIGKKRKRAIKLIITVLSMYLICFLPSNVLLVVHYSQIKNYHSSNIYAVYIVALCLSTLNSCLDPFIYYFVSKDFRDHLKNALLCRSVRTTKRMQVSLTSSRYPRKKPSYSSSSNTTKSTY